MLKHRFPACSTQMNEKPLVYLDSAATTQKPDRVIAAMTQHLNQALANVHRSNYTLAAERTDAFEQVRIQVAHWLNAKHAHEIIWTSGTTEAINRVCSGLEPSVLQAGDEILITHAEHHANLVPWQQLAQATGAKLIVAPLTLDLDLDMAAFRACLNAKTKIVAMNHVSNVTGKINPIQDMIKAAKTVHAITVVDGAQAVAHLHVDVQALECDFYAFSGHKMYGPTGIGVLYGKQTRLDALDPWMFGGEMVKQVTYAHTEFAPLPFRLEAGTPNTDAVIGLGAAVDFLNSFPYAQRWQTEQTLTTYLLKKLRTLPDILVFGSDSNRIGVVSFAFKNLHAFDVAELLDMQGIALRVGSHCAMPFVQSLGVTETLRASLGLYNTQEDIDTLIAALDKAQEFLK